MSEQFKDRLKAISKAYSSKLEADKEFAAAWHRVSREVILPVLREAAGLALENRSLSSHTQQGNVVSLTLLPGMDYELVYAPHPEGAQVKWTMKMKRSADDESDALPLSRISRELIESQVEDFLRKALMVADY